MAVCRSLHWKEQLEHQPIFVQPWIIMKRNFIGSIKMKIWIKPKKLSVSCANKAGTIVKYSEKTTKFHILIHLRHTFRLYCIAIIWKYNGKSPERNIVKNKNVVFVLELFQHIQSGFRGFWCEIYWIQTWFVLISFNFCKRIQSLPCDAIAQNKGPIQSCIVRIEFTMTQ